MSSGSIQALTDTLLTAIDSQGNVLDMSTVLEVVSILEKTHVTAEDLKSTRLGKFVNMIRRRIVDEHKSLAKRLKKLVKQWQQLLQSKTPNGLSLSTPSPSPKPSATAAVPNKPSTESSLPQLHTTSKPEETEEALDTQVHALPVPSSSSSQSVPSNTSSSSPPAQPLRQTAATNFARNRIKMMQMLSSVHRPSAQFTQPQPLLQNVQQQQQEVQNEGLPQQTLAPSSKSDQEPIQTHLTSSPNPKAENANPCMKEASNFVPLDSVKFNSSENDHRTTSTLPSFQTLISAPHLEQSTCLETLHHDSITISVPSKPHCLSVNSLLAASNKECDMLPERSSPSPECLTVSIPQNVIKLNQKSFVDTKTDSSLTFAEEESTCRNKLTNESLTVSIRTHLLRRVPSGLDNSTSKLKNSVSRDSSKLDASYIQAGSHPSYISVAKNNLSDSHLRFRSCLEHQQSIKPLKPTGALQGVDGCLGEDGAWYAWSDTIQGQNLSVTVLPYIYVDGLDNDTDFYH